jgi:cystathionine gamma-synthase/methionine-gamma-lyase
VLELVDIEAASREAHAAGALVVVDNTFASPVNQRPLESGAALVVHSATKYLGGHSDLTAGAGMGPAAVIEPIWRGGGRKSLGQVIAPDVAFVLARSLRTLAVRVRAHNAGAVAVAQYLAAHPRVIRGMHPSLLAGPAAAIVVRQMFGGGDMVSFVFDGDEAATSAVVDRLRLFARAKPRRGREPGDPAAHDHPPRLGACRT